MRSAWVSLRTTCSGVCRFLVAIGIVLPAHKHGRQDSHSTWTNQPGSGHLLHAFGECMAYIRGMYGQRRNLPTCGFSLMFCTRCPSSVVNKPFTGLGNPLGTGL